MHLVWNLTLSCAFVLVGAAQAQSLVRTTGVPVFGTPDSFSSWSVYSCPDAVDCAVSVDVTFPSGVCTVSAVALIDRHPKQKKQTIIWTLPANPPGYEIQFKDPGIQMTEGGQDMDDVSKALKQHKKKVKQKSMTLLTYDILVEYRIKNSGASYTPCKPNGPAIVNRG